MTTDLPPVPPAVAEFAQKNKIENIVFIKSIETEKEAFSHVYAGVSQNPAGFNEQEQYVYTHYIHILVGKDKIRLASPEEEEKFNRIIFQ